MTRRSTIWGDSQPILPTPIEGCHFIYALLDPFDFKARWVGQTYFPKQRFMNHLSEFWGSSPKNTWMRTLRSKQERPVFITLAVVKTDGALVMERIWIKTLTSQGHPLFNAMDA